MGWWCSGVHIRLLVLVACVTILRVSVGWWCSGARHTLGTGDVTILRVSVGWWCSGVHARLLVLVVLPY